ncbi:MAG: glycosyltransferase [Phycisphaerales bacterium]|nr:glycosyltransferase [Phycisphaerales bacterium]MBT7170867.1 glycosyltransferase [Phycisphaerales bacterium]
MQWTFVTSGFPWPLTSGTWLRVFHQARALLAGGDSVRILCRSRGDDAPGLAAYADAGVEVVRIETPEPPIRPRHALGVCVFDGEFAPVVAQWAKQSDVMVLVNPGALQYAPEARACKRVIADLGDDPILEERRKLFGDLRPGAFLRRLKFCWGFDRDARRYCRDVDTVVMVSETDRVSFARRHRKVSVETVPGGVDVNYFSQTPVAAPEAQPTIYFPGNFAHPPNRDAAELLATKIAPVLRKSVPDLRVVLLGANSPESWEKIKSEHLIVTGFVDDMRDWMAASHAVILPMRIGTGVKNKLLEAWAARRPVIATTLSTQGIAAEAGENLLVADGAEAMADAVQKILQNSILASKLADNGYETVMRDHSWEAVARCYRRIACGPSHRNECAMS